MAKYLARKPSYIAGAYRDASISNPTVITLPDDAEPSRDFEPLDADAVAALAKLGVKKGVSPVPAEAVVTENPAEAAEAEEEKPKKKKSWRSHESDGE